MFSVSGVNGGWQDPGRKDFYLGAVVSLAVHLALLAIFYCLFSYLKNSAPVSMDLDLSVAPAVVPLSRPVKKEHVVPPQAWVAPKAGIAPTPQNVSETAQPVEEQYVPSAVTALKPRWLDGFITDEDYPPQARSKGEKGTVKAEVFIDASGMVKDLKIVQESYPALNEVVLHKLKDAKFTPARDASGKPVPCKMLLPIKFELY